MANETPLTLTDAVDALKGLYGLLQLRNTSDSGWELNHRAVDARRVIALAEAHGTAPLSERGDSEEWILASELTPRVSGWRWIEEWNGSAMVPTIVQFGVDSKLSSFCTHWRYFNPPRPAKRYRSA